MLPPENYLRNPPTVRDRARAHLYNCYLPRPGPLNENPSRRRGRTDGQTDDERAHLHTRTHTHTHEILVAIFFNFPPNETYLKTQKTPISLWCCRSRGAGRKRVRRKYIPPRRKRIPSAKELIDSWAGYTHTHTQT